MTDVLSNIDKSPVFTPDRRSQPFWTQHEDSVLQASFLVAAQQIQEFERRRLVQAVMPSGFLQVGDRTIKTRGGDDIRVGDLVVGATGSDTNTFYIYAPDEQYTAFVNGWTITLYNMLGNGAASTSPPSADYLAIDVGTAPATGSRFDFAFLEVWKEELGSGDDLSPWGNVDTDQAAFTNDTPDSRVSGGAVNAIVELRSRLRVVEGVGYADHPLGLDDTANVFARGGASADTSHTFTYQGRGLWRAGSGNGSSRSALSSTDGYAYAIPIAVVFRRNRDNWSSTNLNGAEVIGTTATRPDGLSSNEVAAADVDDLRPHIGTFVDLGSLVRDTRHRMAANTLRLGLRQDDVSNTLWGTEIQRVEDMETVSGITSNSVRRRFSDEVAAQECSAFMTTGSSTTGLSDVFTYTQSSKEIEVVASEVAASATVADTTPTVVWTSTGNDAVLTDAGWSGLGTATATATLDNSASTWQSSGEFMISADVTVPAAAALTRVPSEVHSAVFGTGTSPNMYVASTLADLNLTNLSSNNANGVLVDGRTRGITEIARRQNGITASAAGVAQADGPILDASGSGTINGRIVTGLSNGQTINVVYGYAPSSNSSNNITVRYSYRPPLTPPLPTTLDLEMLYMEPVLVTSNLGTGGGHRGQPYLSPLLHVPESTTAHTTEPDHPDASLDNHNDLTISDFGGNWGVINLPALFETPWQLISELSDGATDNEGRTYYGQADQPYVARAQTLSSGQWHRTAQYGLGRVRTTDGVFLQDELVLVCFSETTDEVDNKVGVRSDADSSFAVGVYPLRTIL